MHRSVPKNVLLALCVAGFLAATADPVRAADDIDTKALAKAKKCVEDNQKSIAFFAHPTCTFDGLKYSKSESTRGGFRLTYNMNYTSAFGYAFYSHLSFDFDSDGYYESVRSAGRNCTVAPFTAADLVITAIKDTIKDDPDLQENKQLQRLIASADALGILKLMLRSTQ